MLKMSPVVDVVVLRVRYFATLALALLSGFMVIETFAFGQSLADDLGFALGIAVTAGAGAGLATSMVRRGPKQRLAIPTRGIALPMWDAIAVVTGIVGAWQIIQASVFSGAVVRWLTFADGCGLLGIALAGLIVHELSTERVVHALEIVGGAVDRDSHASRERARDATAAAA